MASWKINLAAHWKNPQDIFSLLLIIGGDIVHTALAQLVGNTEFIPAPVPFSFGWVAYAYNSIGLSIGEGRLMPLTTDVASVVINASNGISRMNNSWVLGRLLRDMEPDVRTDVALRIEVHKMTASKGWFARHDLLWWTGVLVILAQFAIAAIPAGLDGDWTNLIITGGGSALALTHSLFPQWQHEKWACRRSKRFKDKTVCVTKGNGSQYVLAIEASGGDRNLEDLASGRSHPSTPSKYLSIMLAALWIALLITATSAKNHSWYLVVVGLLGMLQNIYAAGARRSPEAHGIPLQPKAIIEDIKVMEALKKAEKQYPGLGRSLLETFFPQGLRPDELDWWNQQAPQTHPAASRAKPAASQTKPAAPQAQPTPPQAQLVAP